MMSRRWLYLNDFVDLLQVGTDECPFAWICRRAGNRQQHFAQGFDSIDSSNPESKKYLTYPSLLHTLPLSMPLLPPLLQMN
jgi:hypothetical protein